ncbi:MAG: hypothetical protein ABR884_01370 [Minisyncoccia bacterium]|jgi:hypothetical protein
MWKQWVNLVLGLLVVVLAYSGAGTVWYVLVGIVIALLALWAVLEKKA